MTRLFVLATFLALPIAVFAQTCAEKHQAQSCAEGSKWNSETASCDPIVSS